MPPEAVIAILLAAWAPTAILAAFLKFRETKRHTNIMRAAGYYPTSKHAVR